MSGTKGRVLISFLVGRPVIEIARRAGCSPRLVHKVVRSWIYELDEFDRLERWDDLGLVKFVDGPEVLFEVGWEDDERGLVESDSAVVACLVCHHPAGVVELEEARSNRWVIEIFDGRFEPGWGAGPSLLGHMFRHFTLNWDPIAEPKVDPMDPLAALIGRGDVGEAAERRLRLSRVHRSRFYWWEGLDAEVLDLLGRGAGDDPNGPLPLKTREDASIRAGQAMAPGHARRQHGSVACGVMSLAVFQQ